MLPAEAATSAKLYVYFYGRSNLSKGSRIVEILKNIVDSEIWD